jgi:site-specific recombinase XerD
MKVKAILWSHACHQDGTADVKIYIYAQGKKKYLSAGVSVDPSFWDKKACAVKKTHPLSNQLNSLINRKKIELEEKLLAGGNLEALNPEVKKKESLINFAALFIKEVESGLHPIKPSTCKNYVYSLAKLKKYAQHKKMPDLMFEDITMEWYYEFSNYLKDHHNCNRPGISKHIKIVKKFLSEATNRGINQHLDFKKPGFKVFKEHNSNKIYLTADEVAKIEKLNLKDNLSLQKERDRFLVGYYCIMRWSDTVAIRRDNFFEQAGRKFLRYHSQKEDIETILPVKPIVWQIMERYEFNLSGSSNQQANQQIKMVGALAGIIEDTKEGPKKGPKFSFISTHTARRSGATNLVLGGASLKTVADLGGWKRIETLKLYLRASGIDTALMASDLEFFK